MLLGWEGAEGKKCWGQLTQRLGQCIIDPKQKQHKLPVSPCFPGAPLGPWRPVSGGWGWGRGEEKFSHSVVAVPHNAGYFSALPAHLGYNIEPASLTQKSC